MPQPIDPFTELARTTAAERIQQIADRASIAAQVRTSGEAAALAVNQETQVQKSDPKNGEVDEELKRKNPFVGRRRKKKKDEGESGSAARTFYNAHEQRQTVEDEVGNDFDVSI